MIKLFAKVRDVRYLSGQKTSITQQNLEIKDLIIQLTYLLQNCEEGNIEIIIT